MRSPSRTTVPAAVFTAAVDALLILVFAAIGRDAHARGDVITGVFATAWPFLAGAAIAWLAVRAWRAPLALWPAGVAVWIGAVAGGMLLRAITGQSVVLPFVIVALISLAVFLLGYRGIIALGRRFRRSRPRA
ncbi:DUF3054 domain-containing protein [Arthrobacter cavernae]|uniref:DUF3054 domain-containing protein n=1 Tax=Arthrobacter cavernae TaxID=2817681 RepID=A0A939KP78_9MICC|nr:DUF3054 domain-containing protein [Arthrobacter cavernae]MBO1268380.1 DUF3054 domain-containing protein [Arthrobacter cavernae]